MLDTFSFVPTESVIEGIGNELLFFIGFISLVSFLILAWMSTGVSWELLPVRITLVQDSSGSLNTSPDSDLQTVHPEFLHQENTVDSEQSASSSDEAIGDDYPIVTQMNADRATGNSKSTYSYTSATREENRTAEKQEEYASRFREKGHIVIRLQYVNDRTRYIHASPDMPISRFKRKHFSEELMEQRNNVRLIFQGRELKEYNAAQGHSSQIASNQDLTNEHHSLRLCDYNVHDGSTIHCLVTPASAPTSTSSEAQLDRTRFPNHRGRSSTSNDSILAEFDMGTRLMEPLFAFLLAFTWFFRIVYRQYFNSVSTFALIALSVFFCGAVFAVNFMNAASNFVTFATRRRNSPEPSTSDLSDPQSTSSASSDVRVVTLTMVARRLQQGQAVVRSTEVPLTGTTESPLPSGTPSPPN
ncbi:Transmembrane and ubiquitin-like domain-containing protein 2 [Clonorchis sinensis]|uniref:Transmembrane and ubiquitin-like domain-containing protein 2 n=2 Tax=Clonorchis sinensis TaxID=79923 RepID=A0A3R7G2S6_CLOSI|nr:Transmembrane and ubiquitin-like domain-containing protein 2 [Clonorchis sinensis]